MSEIQAQVLVVGGGALALLTALTLKKRGIQVMLAGEAPPTSPPPNPELMLVGGDESLSALFQHTINCWRGGSSLFGVGLPLSTQPAYDLATSEGRAAKLREEALLDALGGESVVFDEKAPAFAISPHGCKAWEEAPLVPTDFLLRLQKAVVEASIPQRPMNPKSLSIINLTHPQLALEDGTKFQARYIIFTSARALRKVLPPLGLSLPLRPARGHVLVLQTAQPHGLPLVLQRLQRGHLFVVPVSANQVHVHYDGANDPSQATFNTNPNGQLVAALQQHVGQILPVLAGAALQRCYVAQEWLTPDFMPALGGWPGLPGVLVGTGWGGRSLAYAAGAADVLASLVESGMPPVNIQLLAPNRFASGLWQVVKQPGSLSWQEPTREVDNSMMSTKPDYMQNVQLIETPKAQYASKVQHIEKTVVETAGRRAATVQVREKPKVVTAPLKRPE